MDLLGKQALQCACPRPATALITQQLTGPRHTLMQSAQAYAGMDWDYEALSIIRKDLKIPQSATAITWLAGQCEAVT